MDDVELRPRWFRGARECPNERGRFHCSFFVFPVMLGDLLLVGLTTVFPMRAPPLFTVSLKFVEPCCKVPVPV